MNMFLAIINDTYSEVKEEVDNRKEDFQACLSGITLHVIGFFKKHCHYHCFKISGQVALIVVLQIPRHIEDLPSVSCFPKSSHLQLNLSSPLGYGPLEARLQHC